MSTINLTFDDFESTILENPILRVKALAMAAVRADIAARQAAMA